MAGPCTLTIHPQYCKSFHKTCQCQTKQSTLPFVYTLKLAPISVAVLGATLYTGNTGAGCCGDYDFVVLVVQWWTKVV